MESGVVLAYLFGLILLYVMVRLFYAPFKWVLVVIYHGVAGGLVLWLLNLIGHQVGFHLALNPITALIAGFLGVPGIILLTVAGYLLG